jgi:hypothetical protein
MYSFFGGLVMRKKKQGGQPTEYKLPNDALQRVSLRQPHAEHDNKL